MTTTKRGGYRPNSGAKPKPADQVASVRLVANVTPEEAQEWQRRGRTAWLRAELRRPIIILPAQERLGAEFEKVLHENMHHLYES
jgi:hypothetical protein